MFDWGQGKELIHQYLTNRKRVGKDFFGAVEEALLSIAELRKSPSLGKNLGGAYMSLAYALTGQCKTKEALEAFENAHASIQKFENRNDLSCLISIGKLSFELKMYDRAEKAFRSVVDVLERDPDEARAPGIQTESCCDCLLSIYRIKNFPLCKVYSTKCNKLKADLTSQ